MNPSVDSADIVSMAEALVGIMWAPWMTYVYKHDVERRPNLRGIRDVEPTRNPGGRC